MVTKLLSATLFIMLIGAESVMSDQNTLFTNPLSSKCVKKSCVETFRKFHSLTDDLILDRYHFVLVHRLKCLVVLRLVSERNSISNDSACHYHTSEGFIKNPDAKSFTSDFYALHLYKNLLDKILGELYRVMKYEENIDSGHNFMVTVLQISKNVKSLCMRINSIVQEFSECSCELLEDTKETYIQGYDSLKKKI